MGRKVACEQKYHCTPSQIHQDIEGESFAWVCVFLENLSLALHSRGSRNSFPRKVRMWQINKNLKTSFKSNFFRGAEWKPQWYIKKPEAVDRVNGQVILKKPPLQASTKRLQKEERGNEINKSVSSAWIIGEQVCFCLMPKSQRVSVPCKQLRTFQSWGDTAEKALLCVTQERGWRRASEDYVNYWVSVQEPTVFYVPCSQAI